MIPSTLTRLPVPWVRKYPHSIIAATNNMLEYLDASPLFSTNKRNTLVPRNTIFVSSDQRINNQKLVKMTHQKLDELLYLIWKLKSVFPWRPAWSVFQDILMPFKLAKIQWTLDWSGCLSGLFLQKWNTLRFLPHLSRFFQEKFYNFLLMFELTIKIT